MAMRDRCTNPKRDSFKHYGGRGIKVCERWQVFEHFFSDVGEGKDGWSIDRVDNNGDYEASNICWAMQVHQARHTRTNKIVTVRGITDCVAALAERFNIRPVTVYHRLKRGWPTERAFFEPARKNSGRHTRSGSEKLRDLIE